MHFELKKLSYIEFLIALSKAKEDSSLTVELIGNDKMLVCVDVGEEKVDIKKFEISCTSISKSTKVVVFGDSFPMLGETRSEKISATSKVIASDEVERYYADLRTFIKERELTNSSPKLLTRVPKGRKISVLAANLLIKSFTTKDAKRVIMGTENIPDGPVIYLSLHRDDLDNFIGIPEIKGPAAILHGATVKPILLKAQEITGWIAVNKDDVASRVNSRFDSCRVLMEGISIWVYPEAAHNLSPNKLWLPWSYTALEWARVTGCPIIPVIRDYEYSSEINIGGGLKASETYSYYGKPINVDTTDLIADKVLEVEQQWFDMLMAAMRKKDLVMEERIPEESIPRVGIKLFLNSNLSWKTRVSGLGHYLRTKNVFFANDVNKGNGQVNQNISILEKGNGVSARVRTREYVRVLTKHLLPGLRFAGLTREYEDSTLRSANEERYLNGDSFLNAHPVDEHGNLVEQGITVGSFDEAGNFIRPTKEDAVVLSRSCEKEFPEYYRQNAFRYSCVDKTGHQPVVLYGYRTKQLIDKSDGGRVDEEPVFDYPMPAHRRFSRKSVKKLDE